MNTLRHIKHSAFICYPKPAKINEIFLRSSSSSQEAQTKEGMSKRMEEFKRKLKEEPFEPEKPPAGRQITPIRKLDQKTLKQPKSFEYPEWPNSTNPHTGEIGGPRGPEPTRYGDWERKGRCTDF